MPSETRTYNFPDRWNGNSSVKVWCDGRLYDAVAESYYPIYSYQITTSDWEYIDNDIRGKANELPDVAAGAQSLFAFLYACQEGLPEDTEGKRENANLFPPHVREWAYLLSEEITTIYDNLVKEVRKKNLN